MAERELLCEASGYRKPRYQFTIPETGSTLQVHDEGITNGVVDGRRIRAYFVPIARPRKTGQKQPVFDTEWTQDRIGENKLVNQIGARAKD